MSRPSALARALVAAATCLAAPAGAFEYFDGRLQVHGYFEGQFRAIARDMSANDDWDLTQWYNVLNVEIEAALAPDGFGPFDLVSAFVRVEARYDCVWTKACGMFPSVDTYGNNARHFPFRYADGRESGLTGAVETGDRRLRHGIPIDQLGFHFKDFPQSGTRTPAYIWHVPGVSTLFGVPGPDGVQGTDDDPAFYVFDRYVQQGEEYRFGLRRVKGGENGRELQVLGPWGPRNTIVPNAALSDRANPFNPLDVNPIFGTPGAAALPFRPAPEVPVTQATTADRSRGLHYPNAAVARLLRSEEFDDFDQNFSEEELAWNRGASQQDEKELKEAYLDIEMFDSRLWIRVGKQSIVWGKTELFRTTDQFNPQDLALSTLPSLEESRISLWSARAVWSFYDVGPLEDVRAEIAANFDDFEPADIGRCGEPYTPFPACDKTAGLFAHGLAGFGLAGEVRPPDPWDSQKGIEIGARLEFRWDRFSFALTDFYGYEDLPWVDPVFLYERNVDPRTGRPRRAGSRAGCDPDGLFDGDTSGCLQPGVDAARNHHANLSRFAVICAASVGFNELDRSACAQSVFNSAELADPPIGLVSELLGWAMAGSPESALTIGGALAGVTLPTVPLNQGPTDGPGQGVAAAASLTLGNTLTDEQEALLGCGSFWGTTCDVSTTTAYGGLDLLNADLSILAQSWLGAQGTSGDPTTLDASFAQPGTVGFRGGPAGRVFYEGVSYVLPGARSPFATETDLDPSGWNANVDGCVSAMHAGCAGQGELLHPYTGQYFASELATFSWNFEQLLVALSGLGKPAVACPDGQVDTSGCRQIDEFLTSEPLRLDGCSFAKPQLCANVQALFAVAHTTRKTVRAGGNGRLGRMQFDWHDGGSGVLRYERRNVLGFAMDFAEDRSKSTWSLEATWIEGVPYEDNDQIDGTTDVDAYNLTVSVDRPTFIDFLNADRTFFINTQWFFQYLSGYREGMVSHGPFNVLATLRVETGYYRDRLTPGFTLVYDFNSASGAMIPDISYRFTENLSATVSVAWFWGRFDRIVPPTHPVGGTPFRGGKHAQNDYTEEGLSPVSDRDEVSLILRYTF
ncbi:MAG: hypothetical protein OZ948_09860 [Deltaproteobacteria bacterium]|nr:hypothetical protein [Deltaproteobacteria bacterium]